MKKIISAIIFATVILSATANASIETYFADQCGYLSVDAWAGSPGGMSYGNIMAKDGDVISNVIVTVFAVILEEMSYTQWLEMTWNFRFEFTRPGGQVSVMTRNNLTKLSAGTVWPVGHVVRMRLAANVPADWAGEFVSFEVSAKRRPVGGIAQPFDDVNMVISAVQVVDNFNPFTDASEVCTPARTGILLGN